MSRYCLDTSAYSNFQRGHTGIVELIDQAEWIGVPSIVLGELWMGFLGGRTLAKNQQLLTKFLANPLVEEITVGGETPRLYGEIATDLRQRGTPIPTNDLWIAACAVRTSSTILTFDSHFDLVSRVGKLVLE